MPKVSLRNGLVVHYESAGYGAPLVMIHGLTGNLAVWHLKIVPYLWDDFEVITYDLRGHGYTQVTPAGYTAREMAADLLQLLDGLQIDQPYLVGHSFGADIALYFALTHPERIKKVVAIEPALPALIELRKREDWVGWTYWNEVLEAQGCAVPPEHRCDLDYMLRLSLQLPKKWGPLVGLPRNPKPFLHLLDSTTLVRDYEDIGELTLENVTQIKSEVTLICCESSAFISTYNYLLEHLPNVKGILLPRTEWGHFGPLEQPDVLAEHLLTNLARETAGGAGQKVAAE